MLHLLGASRGQAANRFAVVKIYCGVLGGYEELYEAIHIGFRVYGLWFMV